MLEIIVTTCLFLGVTSLVYYHVGVGNILASYRLWFAEGYWVNYNVVEAVLMACQGCRDFAGAYLAERDLAAAYRHALHLGATDLGV